MGTNTIIILTSSLFLAAATFFFREAIKNIINKFSSNLSKRQTNIIFIVLLIFFASIPFLISSFGVFPDTTDNTPAPIHIKENSDIDEYVENGIKVDSLVESKIEKKHLKDSIKRANRKQIWVYQIGTPKKYDSELIGALKLLDTISNICVFKKSRKSYYIIKDDGCSKKELENSLDSVKSMLAGITKRVDIINLDSFCNKKEKIKEIKKITDKKNKIEIPCFECDKK